MFLQDPVVPSSGRRCLVDLSDQRQRRRRQRQGRRRLFRGDGRSLVGDRLVCLCSDVHQIGRHDIGIVTRDVHLYSAENSIFFYRYVNIYLYAHTVILSAYGLRGVGLRQLPCTNMHRESPKSKPRRGGYPMS